MIHDHEYDQFIYTTIALVVVFLVGMYIGVWGARKEIDRSKCPQGFVKVVWVDGVGTCVEPNRIDWEG